MDNTPNEVPAAAPAAESVTPTPTAEQTPAPVPDMHGFTSEQLADIKKFFDNSGGFEAVKAKISNPTPTPTTTAPTQAEPQNPTSQTQAPAQTPEPQFKMPAGAISQQEFLAGQYFKSLAKEEKYASIAKGIESGEYLKEMAAFGINALNPDNSINDDKVRMYLDLKAQTIPAQPTSSDPAASTAPTVDYIAVENGQIASMDQAYQIIDQDMRLKAQGLAGHPDVAKAEEYIKTGGKPAQK